MKYFFKFKLRKEVKGFTLIELMVVIALFTTIMTVTIGALYSAQAINTKLQQTQIILDGVNLVTEEIIRDIRYGSVFFCTDTVPVSSPDRRECSYPNGNSVLAFKPGNALTLSKSSSDRIVYYVSNGAIFKEEFPEGAPKAPIQVTSSDILVDKLTFYVKGSGTALSGDYIQPLITLSITGTTKPSNSKVAPVTFSIQTSSSARVMDQ
ncbi:MAG: type II secretion system protein [Candidatus Nomurabacteria bacterium]